MLALRPLERADLSLVEMLDRHCQGPSHWGRNRFAEELDNGDAFVAGAFDGPRLLGYLVLRLMVDELWIFNIGSHPHHRREGVADALMARAVSTSLALSLPLWLEVREGNVAARRLYEKHGFVVVGRRPAYYRPHAPNQAPEAAIQMSRAC